MKQAGLVTYCGFSTVVINNHGGMHEWDLTKSEAEAVLYVGHERLRISDTR